MVTANLQFLSLARKNAEFAGIVNRAETVVADGMPLLWLSRLMGTPIPQRITGHDMLHLCAQLAVREGYSMAFLGGAPGVGDRAAQRLQALYPGLHFAGAFQGNFTSEGYGVQRQDEEELVERVHAKRPDFLLVALGCPKQEFWISRHIQAVGATVCIGVGSVLDVLAGRTRRPPPWMQRAGLEWSYRLLREPRRMWRRYLLGDMPTLLGLAPKALAQRRRNSP
ncbi:MAG: WecB/TagA/CpsF family glycosyltransferase [Chloroflexi bacterium]|nr:WecB/TagA/CpsF family glycosyltransferase [Chloroflexota bacterium]